LELELELADGMVHPQKGRFFMADRQVNQKTGAVRMAGLFPNPGHTLCPGQYANVRAFGVNAVETGFWQGVQS